MDSFVVHKTCTSTKARAGTLHTLKGPIPTPAFIPVASQGVVKTLTAQELEEIGVNIILGNTYHLYLRPGIGVIKKFGGLGEFMGWRKAIITDSGGYQVFSLASLRKISDEGVVFRSHIDGGEHFFTPELSIKVQEELGSDIIMTFDQPLPYRSSYEKLKEALERTHRWAERCLNAFSGKGLLFGILQGGTDPELRKTSAEFFSRLDLPGYAIGGLCLGEPEEITWRIIEIVAENIPQEKVRHLMGLGSPEQIIHGVSLGIDLFDCALPTRVARNGAFFTSTGRKHIKGAEFALKESPLEDDCPCFTCRNFSAAYLHHLHKVGDPLAPRLFTIHNLTFFQRLMEKIRRAILEDRFPQFSAQFLSQYKPTDQEARLSQKRKWLQKWGIIEC